MTRPQKNPDASEIRTRDLPLSRRATWRPYYLRRICVHAFTCCHTVTDVADQTGCLTHSQHGDTGPTGPSIDPMTQVSRNVYRQPMKMMMLLLMRMNMMMMVMMMTQKRKEEEDEKRKKGEEKEKE